MTSSSDEKAEQVRQHLAPLIKTDDAFRVINRKKHPKFNEEVDRLTNGEKADFIFEVGGIKTLPYSIQSIKHGGLVALTGMLTSHQEGDDPTADIATLMLWGGCIARGIFSCESCDPSVGRVPSRLSKVIEELIGCTTRYRQSGRDDPNAQGF
jgi:NADPH:quinone reductase-like Zn-dependent oxidoreductase